MRYSVYRSWYAQSSSALLINAFRTWRVQKHSYSSYFNTCLQQEILRESFLPAGSSSSFFNEGSGRANNSGDSCFRPNVEVSSEGLSHLEGPEADKDLREKLSQNIDNFFSSIPLPENPMAAALAPSPEEIEENAAGEALKEAVREAYWRRLRAERNENVRIEESMKRRFSHLPSPTSSLNSSTSSVGDMVENDIPREGRQEKCRKTKSSRDGISPATTCSPEISTSREEVTIDRKELELLKDRVRELEDQLAIAQKRRK